MLLMTGGRSGGQARVNRACVPNDVDVIRVEVHNPAVAHTLVTRLHTGLAQALQPSDQRKHRLSTRMPVPDYGDGLKMYQDLQRRVPHQSVDKPSVWTPKGETA